MKVLVDGATYTIFWDTKNEPSPLGGERPRTRCWICEGNCLFPEEGVIGLSAIAMAQGWAVLYMKDTFSEWEGRKRSLTKALRLGKFTREQRTQVWRQVLRARVPRPPSIRVPAHDDSWVRVNPVPGGIILDVAWSMGGSYSREHGEAPPMRIGDMMVPLTSIPALIKGLAQALRYAKAQQEETSG